MVKDDFYSWICTVNNSTFEQSTSEFNLFETRLGNSEIFNGTVVSDGNGEDKKHFKINVYTCDECGIPSSIDCAKLNDGAKKDSSTFYIDMNTVEGRKFFIDYILQSFGIFREIKKVVLYYSGTTAYSAKVFVRHKLRHNSEDTLRNFVCSIELLSKPDKYDEDEFKELQYSNPVKPWNCYDDKDLFDYMRLSGDNCNAVFDYISSVDNHVRGKADTVKKTNTDRRLF